MEPHEMFSTQITGQGPTAILIHGMPTTVDYLAPLAEALARTHAVLLPALPGYGGSPALKPYSADAVDRALEQLAGSAGNGPVTIVGFSGGAWRALRMALARRIVISKLILIGPTAGATPEVAEQFRQFAAALRSGADLRSIFPARMLSPKFAARPAVAAAVTAWADAASPDVLADELEAVAAAGDLKPRLSEIEVPVLLRVGALDLATPADEAREIAARFPRSTLEIVPDCGHALLLEDREATVDAILRFLA